MASKKATTAKSTTRTPLTTYVPVSHHIYHDGTSYRVRVSVNGTRYSQNFSSKKKALAFRKSLMTA
jgi:hypothetical protein